MEAHFDGGVVGGMLDGGAMDGSTIVGGVIIEGMHEGVMLHRSTIIGGIVGGNLDGGALDGHHWRSHQNPCIHSMGVHTLL
jgi:hypothetical protein